MSTSKKDEVAVIPPKAELQDKLKIALKKIDAKLKAIGYNTVNDPYQTQGLNIIIHDGVFNSSINVAAMSDVQLIAKALAIIRRFRREYEEVMKEAGIEKYPVHLHCGVDSSRIIHDLEIRLKLVANQTTISALSHQKAELEKFLSDDQKLYNALKSVSDLL